MVGDFLSYDPYGIMFRKNEPQFAAVVERTFRKLATNHDLVPLYEKWLMNRLPTGERLGVPMSVELEYSFRMLDDNSQGTTSEATPQTNKTCGIPTLILVILSVAKDLTERSDTGRVAGVRSFAEARRLLRATQTTDRGRGTEFCWSSRFFAGQSLVMLAEIGKFLGNGATHRLEELHRTCAPPLSHRDRRDWPRTVGQIDAERAQPRAVRSVSKKR